jgi:hypothetical protein
MYRNICDVIVKTLLSTQPFLGRSYKTCKLSEENKCPFTCFEILGFDVILTDTLKPILLEVNHTPSFRMDSALDERYVYVYTCVYVYMHGNVHMHKYKPHLFLQNGLRS